MTAMTDQPLEVNDRVTFRLCDSPYSSQGTVVKVIDNRDEFLDASGVEYARYLYHVRDDRHKWMIHTLGATKQAGSVRRLESPKPREAVEWDGKF
jgi:hypothetical protein